MKEPLNLDEWPRKDHFEFYRQFDEPFFGVCVDIDCTEAYQACKQNDFSFFLYYLHKSLAAANSIEPFRYRIEGKQVFVHDKIHASPTIIRPDNTFGLAYLDYYRDFEQFNREATRVIDKVKNAEGFKPAVSGENVIHYSTLPWLNFTSISHARNFSFDDSCPKISFGKITEKNGIKAMPVSIHVHHALADGYHVSQFVDKFQKLMQ